MAEKGHTTRNRPFIKTAQYFRCKDVFDEHRIVLITGAAGSGKTSIAKNLFKDRKGRTSAGCFEIQHPQELKFISNGTTFLFDDIFGRYVEDVSMTIAWYPLMKKLTEKKRVFFILTSRNDIYSHCKERKEFQFLEEVVVDLSSVQLTNEDQERVLEAFGYPSWNDKSDFGLFQTCNVWDRLRNLPFSCEISSVSKHTLETFFRDVFETRRDLFFLMFITLLYDNKLLEESLKSSKVEDVATNMGFDINEDRLKETLQSLSTSLLEKDEHTKCYSISSSVIFDETCVSSLKHYPDVVIEFGDLKLLDKLSTHFNNMDEVYIKNLCRRLSYELYDVIHFKLYNNLKNDRTLQIFLDILSDCKEQLDMFLNSVFFWYICWSKNFLMVEKILQKMRGKRCIVESALDCSSSEMCTLLQRHLKTDTSEATNIPESPIIEDVMENPLSNWSRYNALECHLEDFPRLRYHSKLLRGIADRFNRMHAEDQQLGTINLKFVHWEKVKKSPIIHLAGYKQENWKNWPFLSNGRPILCELKSTSEAAQKVHSKVNFVSFQDVFLSCVLYRCFEERSKQENISSITELARSVANSELTMMGKCVVVVLNFGIHFTLSNGDFENIPNVQVVISNGEREDLLEHLTSAFEVTMIEYVTLLQSEVVALTASSGDRFKSLKTESDAILRRLCLSSKLPQEPARPVSSKTVPQEVQRELDKHADKIYGYGFRPDEFYILMDESLTSKKRKNLKSEIKKSIQKAKLSWNVTFENSKGVHFTKHFGSGNPVVPDISKPNKYGTLGGFAEVNNMDVVGLTNFHVVERGIEAYVKDGENLIKLGKCTFVLVPGLESLADFALIEVDNGLREQCRKPLVDDEDEPKSATIYFGKPDLIFPAIVHKKGASTGITQGTVVETVNYRDTLGDRETHSAFLVEDLDTPFSAPGDSGSLVFQNSFSASQDSIEVVAILNGRYVKHGETDESNIVLCSDMQHISEKLKSQGKHLEFFKREEQP